MTVGIRFKSFVPVLIIVILKQRSSVLALSNPVVKKPNVFQESLEKKFGLRSPAMVVPTETWDMQASQSVCRDSKIVRRS